MVTVSTLTPLIRNQVDGASLRKKPRKVRKDVKQRKPKPWPQHASR